jgi:hypothetical protein
MTRPNERKPGSKTGIDDDIPGEIGYSYEEDPDKVQAAQPHSLKPLRTNPHADGVEFPSPHIQIDAHIGDAVRPPAERR